MANEYIFDAIMSAFNELDGGGLHNDLHIALGGRLFYKGMVPDQEVFPYGTFFLVVEVPNELLDETAIVTDVLQFDLYSDNSSSYEVNYLMLCLMNLFQDKVFNIDGSQHIGMQRINDFLQPEDDQVWHGILRYRMERLVV